MYIPEGFVGMCHMVRMYMYMDNVGSVPSPTRSTMFVHIEHSDAHPSPAALNIHTHYISTDTSYISVEIISACGAFYIAVCSFIRRIVAPHHSLVVYHLVVRHTLVVYQTEHVSCLPENYIHLGIYVHGDFVWCK